MGRLWLGVGLLIALLLIGVLIATAMDGIHGPLSEVLTQASRAALSGDLEGGTILGRQARADWEKHRYCTAAVADHTPMDEIDSLFAEMEVYAQAEDDAHFAACCAQLAQMVRAMGDAHIFSWWNLL